jgi:HEAT repeat protein
VGSHRRDHDRDPRRAGAPTPPAVRDAARAAAALVKPQMVMALDEQAAAVVTERARASARATPIARCASRRRWAGRTPGADVIDPLLGALKDPMRRCARKAAIGLAFRRDPKIVDPLLTAIDDSDSQVREKAAIRARRERR